MTTVDKSFKCNSVVFITYCVFFFFFNFIVMLCVLFKLASQNEVGLMQWVIFRSMLAYGIILDASSSIVFLTSRKIHTTCPYIFVSEKKKSFLHAVCCVLSGIYIQPVSLTFDEIQLNTTDIQFWIILDSYSVLLPNLHGFKKHIFCMFSLELLANMKKK